MRVPTKKVVTGDITAGKLLLGFGNSQMNILETQMRFQGLKQGSRTVKPRPGVVIECWSCFNLRQIHIHVVSQGGGQEEKRKRCLEFPCFAFGIIEAVSVLTEQQIEDGYRYHYDVSLCTNQAFIILENLNIQSAGWGKYHEGQYVLITIDAEALGGPPPDCCIDKTCLVCDIDRTEKIFKEHLHVVPILIDEGMEKWRNILQ